MKKGSIFFGGLVALAIILGMWYVKVRNQMVEMEEQVNQTWSQVENVYQRRLDLIPNLVATVKGYAVHEQDTLQKNQNLTLPQPFVNTTKPCRFLGSGLYICYAFLVNIRKNFWMLFCNS